MRFTVPEILALANSAGSKQNIINTIRQNHSAILEQLLQYALHDGIQFNIPTGSPPFARDDATPVGMSQSNLTAESRRLYIFLKGHGDHIAPQRRETLFIQILEGVHPTEADLLITIKDKQFNKFYPNITYDIVYEAIPNLLPQRSAKVVDEPVVAPVTAPAAVEHVEGTGDDSEIPLVESKLTTRPRRDYKNVDRSNSARYITAEDGTRIRIKKDGSPWPKPSHTKKV